MALNPRNKAQIEVHDRVVRSNAQLQVEVAILNHIRSWSYWVEHGYAAAFAEAWDKRGMRPDKDGNVDHIVAYVTACANTRAVVAKLPDQVTKHAPGYSQFVS